MATATFTEQGHIYQRDGVIIPSVTQVLTLAGIDDVSMVPAHHLERARQIGEAVHRATEFLDRDDLELDSLDPVIVGYVVAYQKFKEEHKFTPSKIEYRGVGVTRGLEFGFCVDRIGQIKDGESVLLDIKTASRPQHSWAIQTAAYADGVNHEGSRMIVHVAKDGTYKVLPHKGEDDHLVWAGALTVAHWKLQHGVKLK